MRGEREVDRVRRRRVRRIIAFVTFPGILIGTAGVTTAYAGKWFTAPPLFSCTAVERVAPAKSSFTLNVLNAGAVSGEAGVVASELRKRGYAVGSVSNDDVLRSVDGSGEIRYGRKGYDQALYVQQLVPSARLVEVDRPTTAVDLVLGPDYKALTPRPARPPVYPKDIVVNVYNTTYYENLGTTTLDQLVKRGFKRGEVSADPMKTWVREFAVIRYGEKGDLAAKRLATHVPNATFEMDARQDTSVDLLLGMKWKGLIPVGQVEKPPPYVAPKPTMISVPCER